MAHDRSLYNEDLAPVPLERRAWSVYNYASLMLWWTTSLAGGFGPVLSARSKFSSTREFLRFFIPPLTGMVGFWATVALTGRFNKPFLAFVALVALLIAALNTNVTANVVSPSNDFSNLNPRRISFRSGGLITGCIGSPAL